MPLETEKIIKGRIGEAIAEEMFRELGFFVMKLGKEHTANPLDQIKDFVSRCGGKFELKKLDKEIREITHINVLPDFIIVNSDGNVHLLEVKVRSDSKPSVPRDFLMFKAYPEAHMLMINLEVSEDLRELKDHPEEYQKKLKESKFHIWTKKGDYGEDGICCNILDLKDWLKKDFGIENDEVIKKYEGFVVKWLGKGKGVVKEDEDLHPHFVKTIGDNHEPWRTDIILGQKGTDSHGHLALSGAGIYYAREESGKEIVKEGNVIPNEAVEKAGFKEGEELIAEGKKGEIRVRKR